MAVITPGRSTNRPGYFRRSLRKYIRKGQIVAAAFPPERGPHKLTWQKAAVERIKIAMKLIKVTSAREQTAVREALDRYLSKHGGLKGSSAIRARDWLTSNITGRSWSVNLPDGRTLHSAKTVQDMSDFLDTIEPRVGSLMVRGQDTWYTTSQCQPGAVFTAGLHGAKHRCCQEASIPPWQQAVGGYPPHATEMGLFEEPPVPIDPAIFSNRWRLLFLSNNGGNFIECADTEWRETINGADQTSGGTASASSQFSNLNPSNAFDNNPGTRWATDSGEAADAWLRYDFPEPVTIRQITYTYPTIPPSGTPDNAPNNFMLQYSENGTDWTDYAEFSDNTGWSGGENRTFTIE